MTTPVRPSVSELTRFGKPAAELSLREAVDWFKRVVDKAPGGLTALETKHINEQWLVLVEAQAKREDLPGGALLYILQQIAESEIMEAGRAAASE